MIEREVFDRISPTPDGASRRSGTAWRTSNSQVSSYIEGCGFRSGFAMTERSATAEPRTSKPLEIDDVPGDVGFCARPRCRGEFRREDGPGRPAHYCSDLCRKNAAKERRQIAGRLRHFERQVEQLRIDLAAFTGPVDEEMFDATQHLQVRREAELAVSQASGAVVFVRNSEEPAAQQLCRLYDAVAPLFV
jgi:hypothetical protein